MLGPRGDWDDLALSGAGLGSHCPDCLSPALGMPLGKGLTAPAMLGGGGGAFTSSLGEGKGHSMQICAKKPELALAREGCHHQNSTCPRES